MFVGDMEGVHSYVKGICERNGLVGVVEDDMEGVHSSQFLGKNGLMVGHFFFYKVVCGKDIYVIVVGKKCLWEE
ncbi:hypothetical protein Hanom_Chr16g01483141 [Helianthus anomalus]